MNKKIVVSLLAILIPASVQLAEAQQPAKVPRIGFLSARSGPESREEAFRQGLRELGYVEGKNIVIEYRFAKGKADLFPELAAELVRLKVDVIVVGGNQATSAAKNATKTIPIVMASIGDPVGAGFVTSLARPGGNITGLANIVTDLAGKRLELLKEVVPGLSRIAIFYSPSPGNPRAVKETEEAAQSLGVRLQILEVRGPDDFEGVFGAATRGRAGALSVLSDAILFSHRTRIVELAAKHRLPTMHTQSGWVEAGGLMSYGTYSADLFRRSATFVDKILKGAKPADLPVEQPMKFELVINLKTAKQIGLTIPQSVLYRADKVIK